MLPPSRLQLKAPARIDYYLPADGKHKRLEYLPRILEENSLGEIAGYERAEAGELTELPELAIMRIEPVPWVG